MLIIGNTVQPTLPCWVVPTTGSLSISGLLFSFRYILSYNRLGIRFIIAAISFQRFVTYAIFFFLLIAS